LPWQPIHVPVKTEGRFFSNSERGFVQGNWPCPKLDSASVPRGPGAWQLEIRIAAILEPQFTQERRRAKKNRVRAITVSSIVHHIHPSRSQTYRERTGGGRFGSRLGNPIVEYSLTPERSVFPNSGCNRFCPGPTDSLPFAIPTARDRSWSESAALLE